MLKGKIMVTQAEFNRYRIVQESGRYNMITHWVLAAKMARLTQQKYFEVQDNYAELEKKYAPVEKS